MKLMQRVRHLHRGVWILVLTACVLLVASPGWASGLCEKGEKTTNRKVSEGIVLVEQSCEEPLYHAFIVKMDLDEPGYELFVTPYKKRRRTTSEFAEMTGALVAINGGFWGGEWGGFTVSGGEVWPKDAPDLDTSTVVGFGTRDEAGRLKVDIRPTEETLKAPLPWMKNAITGIPMLLEEGKVVQVEQDHTLFVHKHPRTALGTSEDGSTMILAVVDGRQPGYSKGLKTGQLARLLLSHGAHRAVNLDGGSSSTMVIPSLGGLINDPCFKKANERSVPNHLGILRTSPKTASVVEKLLGPLALLLS